MADTLATTPLYDLHTDLGARMMPFGGFDMPVQYSGIIDEHQAVRNDAGLFDVSHMGEVEVTGPQAEAFVQQLVTNDVGALYDGKAMYTAMCTPEGGIIDDLLVYRRAADSFLLVINAGNRAEDWAWMQAHNPMGATLSNRSDDYALLALQGPAAFDIARPFVGEALDDLQFYHFIEAESGAFLDCERAIISRTGYTGEPGLELYLPPDNAAHVWTTLLDAGADHGLKPAGLGARDTLRMEAGFCLHGNDISKDTNPYEAGLGWIVKLEAGEFIGREALRAVHEMGPARKLIAFVAQERGIPRAEYDLLDSGGTLLGRVTSGTQSPTLNTGIGLGYVPNDEAYTTPGTTLAVQGRRRTIAVEVAEPPLHTA